MTTHGARFPVFAANLAAFCTCAGLAFARNINALFYGYDRPYMFVDAREQLRVGQIFEYSNNFFNPSVTFNYCTTQVCCSSIGHSHGSPI
jgi:hypothetical protein